MSLNNTDDIFQDVFSKPEPEGFGHPNTSLDPENITEEAKQAHTFRGNAFSIASYALLAVILIWFIVTCNSPGDNAKDAAFYLWMTKCALSTTMFLSLVLGLLNFAIKCYGHHNNRENINVPSADNTSMQVIGKLTDIIEKANSN